MFTDSKYEDEFKKLDAYLKKRHINAIGSGMRAFDKIKFKKSPNDGLSDKEMAQYKKNLANRFEYLKSKNIFRTDPNKTKADVMASFSENTKVMQEFAVGYYSTEHAGAEPDIYQWGMDGHNTGFSFNDAEVYAEGQPNCGTGGQSKSYSKCFRLVPNHGQGVRTYDLYILIEISGLYQLSQPWSDCGTVIMKLYFNHEVTQSYSRGENEIRKFDYNVFGQYVDIEGIINENLILHTVADLRSLDPVYYDVNIRMTAETQNSGSISHLKFINAQNEPSVNYLRVTIAWANARL